MNNKHGSGILKKSAVLTFYKEVTSVVLWRIYAVKIQFIVIGVASMRQEEAVASSSYNCVLVSSVKSSLNTAPKCSILKSNNKKICGGDPLPRHHLPAPTPLGASAKSALDLSTLSPLKLKSGYAFDSLVVPVRVRRDQFLRD